MKTYELDIVTEEVTLEEAVAQINAIEGATVILTSENGYGSGWPTVIVSATDEAFPALQEWYGSEIVE
jgi:hypothetical protein